MGTTDIVSINSNEITEKENSLSTTIGDYQNQLYDFLNSLNLPSDKILVDFKERRKVINNIPDIIENMDNDVRSKSYYISKFIAASGAGLFDAALNYIWDETITSLRNKIVLFDLEYFKSTLEDDKKKKVTVIDDLKKIDDNDVVNGCKDIGILSDIGFKHIDYIRTMRNWVSAAHPNQVELTGLNICDWLEICIKEVIGKEPSHSAIQTKQLLTNIRNNTYTINDVIPIKNALKNLPQDSLIALHNALFGMFCDPSGKVEIKNNIRLIAKDLWQLLPEQIKKETGLKYAHWAVNGDAQRKTRAHEFLETVDGLSYLTEDVLSVELSDALQLLYNTHFGWSNFHNEPPFAKLIRKYIPENGEIPDVVRMQYVKTLFLCRIGNAYGVSVLAEPIYDELIGKFSDKEIKEFIKLFSDLEIRSQLGFSSCQRNLKDILAVLKNHTSNTIIIRAISYIESKHEKQWSSLYELDDFKKIISLL